MKTKQTLLLILILSGYFSLLQAQMPYTLAFYNVENLFDIHDDPKTLDEDFTPDGRQKWDQERYETKLDRIAEVMEGMNFPVIMGLCEVENQQVCEDLSQQKRIKDQGYAVAHVESPDRRGIDNALLYKTSLFQVDSVFGIQINFPEGYLEEEDYTTRDILVVQGKFNRKRDLTIIVNHWPSRRGGLKESEPKRTYAAKQLGTFIDEMYAKNNKQRIIIMGDFNDEPENKSIQEVLGASMDKDLAENDRLVNLMGPMDQAGEGSYNFRGNWNMLDQIMISPFLLKRKSKFKFGEPKTYRPESIIFKHDKYGDMPNRTYGGPNYYGGYSDHFAVYVPFKAK